jgi:CBS domain-containing protein
MTTVKDVMTPQVEWVTPDTTLREAAELMRTLDIGPLPVCEHDRVVGIVTDRDITLRATAEGLDPWTTRVREVMTPNVVSCYEDQDIEEAERVMKERQLRRLLVLDRDQRLAGIVSLGDLAVHADDAGMAGEALQGVSEPARPRV